MAATNQKMKCPFCGKFVKNGTVFCIWCGETIGEIPENEDNEQETSTSTPTPAPKATPIPPTTASNNREFVKSSSLGGSKNNTNATTVAKKEEKKEVIDQNQPVVDEIVDDYEDDDEVDDDISDEEAEYRALEDSSDDITDEDESEDDDDDSEEDIEEDADDEDENDDEDRDDDDAFYKALSGQGVEDSARKKKSISVANSLGKLKEQGAEAISQTVNNVKSSTENYKAIKPEKNNKKEPIKESSPKKENVYNPNYDGYYNDLCEIIDAKTDSIAKDSLIRTITLIVILFITIIGMMYYI